MHITSAAFLFDLVAATALMAQAPGDVVHASRLDGTTPGFTDTIPTWSRFGSAVASLGDLDGDGAHDLLVGAREYSEPTTEAGALYVVLRDGVGGVKDCRRITSMESGFDAQLAEGDHFGWSAATLGDLEGDGKPEVAVGAIGDAEFRGAVYLLSLEPDGSVASWRKLDSTSADLAGLLDPGDVFGSSVAGIGDFNGDGVPDLAVGAFGDHDGQPDPPGYEDGNGAVYVLFLHADGTIASHVKISETSGGFTGDLAQGNFGSAVDAVGDLDADGVTDLAVGAYLQGDGFKGALWILLMNADGTVRAAQKVGNGTGGFSLPVSDWQSLGSAVTGLGDVDGDAVPDLLLGGFFGDSSTVCEASGPGLAWMLAMKPDGTVKTTVGVSASLGFGGQLDDGDNFGISSCRLPDIDGNGIDDVAIGAMGDDDPLPYAGDPGAVWILRRTSGFGVLAFEKISLSSPGMSVPTLDGHDLFGSAVAPLGDFDGDGLGDLVVGSPGALDVQFACESDSEGALWILRMAADCTVKSWQKISDSSGNFPGPLFHDDQLGLAVANLGDLDGDGTTDIAVGRGQSSISPEGEVWILFLNETGIVKTWQRIAVGDGGFVAAPGSLSGFGQALASPGDIDGDGVTDLAVTGTLAATNSDLVWVLFLNPNGTVKGQNAIDEGQSGFTGNPAPFNGFGAAGISGGGDINHDGVPDLAVGDRLDGGSAPVTGKWYGGVWTLLMRHNGAVKEATRIASGVGGMPDVLTLFEQFGASIAAPGDLDGDGTGDLVVGAPRHDGSGVDSGAIYVLGLVPDGSVNTELELDDVPGLALAPGDLFGAAGAGLGDLDGDGGVDLAVGLSLGDSPGWNNQDEGAVALLELHAEPAHWEFLGGALGVGGGVPLLYGTGVLDGATPAALHLLHAKPSAPVVLVFGLDTLNAPFKGGLLVPSPLLILGGLVTDGAGELPLDLPWPAGLPSGLTPCFQYWIPDVTGPKGFAASNGLQGITP